MGVADELGLDILLNALRTVSADYIGIKQTCIGGQHADWPIPAGYSDEVRLGTLPIQNTLGMHYKLHGLRCVHRFSLSFCLDVTE